MGRGRSLGEDILEREKVGGLVCMVLCCAVHFYSYQVSCFQIFAVYVGKGHIHT